MYLCSLCNKAYQWPHSLTRHVKYKHSQQHNQLKGYSCPQCSTRYQWPHDLTRHIKIKHSQNKLQHYPVYVQQQQQEMLKKHEMLQQEQKQQEILTDIVSQQQQQQQKQQQQQQEEMLQHQHQHHQEDMVSQQQQSENLTSMGKQQPTELKNQEQPKQKQQSGYITDLETLMQKDYPIPKYMFFKHPFTMLISGPSGCGKTVFVRKLLQFREQMIDQPLQDIIWCHGITQPLHQELKNEFPIIKFNNGLPDPAILSENKPQLVILDDLMNETKGNIVANLFAKWSHHTNTSVIYITQNLFPKNKENRDISLNSKYIVVFKNPRDGQQISFLGTQMGKQKFISEAFQEATVKPHGYLMLDLTQDAKDELRTRTQIFPNDQVNIVFLP